MAEEHVVTYLGTLTGGKHVIQHADGRLEHQESQTDWALLDRAQDEGSKDLRADDPDFAHFSDIDWLKVNVARFTPKQAISIRLDPEVLDFFKKDGPGYQSRINNVLRHFMRSKQKTG
jgi:uncharacterized protein (DUF4415 family)